MKDIVLKIKYCFLFKKINIVPFSNVSKAIRFAPNIKDIKYSPSALKTKILKNIGKWINVPK